MQQTNMATSQILNVTNSYCANSHFKKKSFYNGLLINFSSVIKSFNKTKKTIR